MSDFDRLNPPSGGGGGGYFPPPQPANPYAAGSGYGGDGEFDPGFGTAPIPVAVPVAAPVAQPYHGAYASPAGYGGPNPVPGPPMAAGVGVPVTASPIPAPVEMDQLPVVDPGWKDVWAGALFWIHAFVIVVLAFAIGIPAMSADAASGDVDPDRPPLDFNASLFVRMVVLALFASAAVSAIFFQVLKRFGGSMIKFALYTSLAVQLVFTALAFAFSVGAGIFLLLLFLLSAWYVWAVKRRIPFAAAHLALACDVVNTYPSLFLVAVGMMAVQGLWCLFWAMAALGIQSRISGGGGVVVFILLVSFYWGAQVFKNVVHYVTASTTGNWWFLGSLDTAVRGSTHRAFTTNFGSIAFGSLIVAVLTALESMARAAKEKAQNRRNAAAAACGECILNLVRRAVEYFNNWAYIYMALTGSSFVQAGKEVIRLFRSRGWDAVINDDLTGTAMALVCLMVGVISAVLSGGVAYVFMAGGGAGSSAGGLAGVVAFLSFLIGIAMASVMTGVLTSSVRTVFVCFAMAPGTLAATHPTHLNTLVTAWHAAHPNELSACGYTARYLPAGTAM